MKLNIVQAGDKEVVLVMNGSVVTIRNIEAYDGSVVTIRNINADGATLERW